MSRPRRWPWLVGAAILVATAGLVMWLGEPVKPARPFEEKVDLPRRMDPDERKRADRRRTLPPPVALAPNPGAAAPAYLRPRDPVLAALPSQVKRGAVVIEANAIRNSPIGELLVDCLFRDAAKYERLKSETGIDPLKDVDRLVVADESLMVTGDFTRARWDHLFGDAGTAVGERGRLLDIRRPDGGSANFQIGIWGDQMLVMGPDPDAVQAALERIEGGDRGERPLIDESQTYGEIYGVLSGEGLAELLPDDQAAIAERLKSGASRVELHVDTTHDVGVVADVTGAGGSDTDDLGKALGAALAVARVKAQADGKSDIAELLDLARVRPGDGQFKVEMGLPLQVLEKYLRNCRKDAGG